VLDDATITRLALLVRGLPVEQDLIDTARLWLDTNAPEGEWIVDDGRAGRLHQLLAELDAVRGDD
jgi:hypothetical protein